MPTEDQESHTPDIRSLREAAEAGRAAQAELAEARRQLMFAKAGIDTESKLGSMLYKTWEGEDIDALKAEATEIGLLGTATPQQSNDDVASQQEFRRGLSQGAPPAAYEPPSVDPRDAALATFHSSVQAGMPQEDAQLAAFDQIFTAAVAGDERVIFNPDTWQDSYRR